MDIEHKKSLLQYLKFAQGQPKGFIYRDNKKKHTEKPTTVEDKKKQLEKLYAKYKQCLECPLATQGRTQVVFGSGNPDAKLLFVGEGPGREEDLNGEAFIGRAGQLLSKIIEAMGLDRSKDLYISNVVKCRPPQNRTPLPNERNTCKEIILFKEIEIIQPKIICTLGAAATQGLLGDDVKISAVRGTFHDFKNMLVLPTYHPAYLLRNPAEKRTVWEDMKKIMEKLSELNK